MIGHVVGNYQIAELLGEGGMGIVYRATDVMLERDVALKALRHDFISDASKLERFRSEAKTLANLVHPNIAMVYSFFEHYGDYYMAMEFVDGETFEGIVRRMGILPLRTTLELFCQSLMGFSFAHSKNIIHRDIKPGNLMLTTAGQVKITDFGIARVLGQARMTQAGKIIGTLEYMSPEQIQGKEQDNRSDIYSLGILLYEMITGRVPFSSTSDYEIMRCHLEIEPPAPRDFSKDLPDEVQNALQKALAKDPAQRYQNVMEFHSALSPIINQLPEAPAIQTKPKATRMGNVPMPPPSPVSSPHTQPGGTPPATTVPQGPPPTNAGYQQPPPTNYSHQQPPPTNAGYQQPPPTNAGYQQPPPPQQPAGGYQQPYPYQQPVRKKSGGWVWVFVGCLGFVFLGVIAILVLAWIGAMQPNTPGVNKDNPLNILQPQPKKHKYANNVGTYTGTVTDVDGYKYETYVTVKSIDTDTGAAVVFLEYTGDVNGAYIHAKSELTGKVDELGIVTLSGEVDYSASNNAKSSENVEVKFKGKASINAKLDDDNTISGKITQTATINGESSTGVDDFKLTKDPNASKDSTGN